MQHPHDDALPELASLLDPLEASAMLEAALSDTGEHVVEVRVVDVSYRPGRRATVRYAAILLGRDGERTTTGFTAWIGDRIPRGGLRLQSQGAEIGVWRFPDDPYLPGLSIASSTAGAARLLNDLGVEAEQAEVTLRAYRPGRRAVVEVHVGALSVFIKVVRPSRVEALQQLHTALTGSVPIPRSLGWSPKQGLVVLERLAGKSLSDSLVSGTATMVPSADDLVEMLSRLEASEVPARSRPASVDRVAEHAATITAVLPELHSDLQGVVERTADIGVESTITAHRDFHAGQLLIHQGQARLVDIDTVGPGTRADDMAMFIAQLVCLARPGPNATAISEYLMQIASTDLVDAAALDGRVAASLLGFALGPFRVQEADWETETRRRISAAVKWSLGRG